MKVMYEFNIHILTRFLRRYLLWIVLFSILCGMGTALVKLRTMTVQYSSTGSLVQNGNNSNIVSAYQQFVESRHFKEIMNSKIDKGAWKNSKYKDKYDITLTSNGTNSPFFTMKATSKNREYSEYLATTSMNLFIVNIGKYLSGANVSIIAGASKAYVINFRSSLIKSGVIGGGIVAVILTLCCLYAMLCVGKIGDDKYINDMYQIKMIGTYVESQRR